MRAPKRETASLGWNPSNAAVCLSPEKHTMTYKADLTAEQGIRRPKLGEVVNALKLSPQIGALICLHQTDAGYHGHYIHWQGELPRIMDGLRDHARLLVRLEEIGLPTSGKILGTALRLVPTVPEGMHPIRFLEAQGAAA